MMKSLNVPLLDFENQDLDTALELGGARIDVNCVNWPGAFPYAPLCNARIARTQDALVIDFRVSGLDLRAQNLQDNGQQWEDSCVEIFIQDPETPDYYNFEINPLGKVLAAAGPDRSNRKVRPTEEMEQILRFAQNDICHPENDICLPEEEICHSEEDICHPEEAEPTKDLEGLQSWRVGVIIPFELIGVDPENLPKTLRANFYKCGDKTAHPHFLSWNPVETPQPDFHRPEFFGELRLA